MLSLLVPVLCLAAGLVPCGRAQNDPDTPYDETESCNICHFFLMFKLIILDFIILKMAPLAAILRFVIAGAKLLIAGGDPGALNKAKTEITNTVLIVVLIFGAWIIINTVLGAIGVATWTGLEDWWVIDCSPAGPGGVF